MWLSCLLPSRELQSGRLLAVLPIDPSADVRFSITDIAPDLETVWADADVPPPAQRCHGVAEEVGDFCDGEQAVLVVHGRGLSLVVWRLPAVIGTSGCVVAECDTCERVLFRSDMNCSGVAFELRSFCWWQFGWRLAQPVGTLGGGSGQFGSVAVCGRVDGVSVWDSC